MLKTLKVDRGAARESKGCPTRGEREEQSTRANVPAHPPFSFEVGGWESWRWGEGMVPLWDLVV